jgi:transcriptional regulator with XRE-family HTH domain
MQSTPTPGTSRAFLIHLGEQLRAVRQGLGLSLDGAGALSNGMFSPVAIGSYERGERRMTADRLWALARMYGVRVVDLLPPEDDTEDAKLRMFAAGMVQQLAEMIRTGETPQDVTLASVPEEAMAV